MEIIAIASEINLWAASILLVIAMGIIWAPAIGILIISKEEDRQEGAIDNAIGLTIICALLYIIAIVVKVIGWMAT